MKIAVAGLWHLGSVTAACLARAGHEVIGWDPDQATVAGLAGGRAPIAEPGLDAVVSEGIASGRLRTTSVLVDAVRDADVLWVTFDTPVDEEDNADVEGVLRHVRAALAHLKDDALVIVSSQMPVGSVARLEHDQAAPNSGRRARFACLPENLRLGKAIQVFTQPDRVVAGVRTDRDRAQIAALLAPITDRIVWMSVESAEMTKHAINAFLATSVAFINEIAVLGETAGADAKEVERGLKSDQRIGQAAYLSPGAAFAGGTLGRDVALLEGLATAGGREAPLVSGVLQSNRRHARWSYLTLKDVLAPLSGRRFAVWGLTYKPGTDTLRRSPGVDLCRALAADGARVAAFDPAVATIPDTLGAVLTLAPDALSAASGADAVVVATEWPEFRTIAADALVSAVKAPLVLDPGRFLSKTMGADARIRYLAVGVPRA